MKAIVQQVEIRNSEMFYNSRFVRTRNYKANLEAGKFQNNIFKYSKVIKILTLMRFLQKVLNDILLDKEKR